MPPAQSPAARAFFSGDPCATGADVLDVNSSLETSPGVKSLDLLAPLLRMLNDEVIQLV